MRQAASIDVQEVEMVELGKWNDLFICLPGGGGLGGGELVRGREIGGWKYIGWWNGGGVVGVVEW